MRPGPVRSRQDSVPFFASISSWGPKLMPQKPPKQQKKWPWSEAIAFLQPSPAYWQTLGQFIETFADIEARMFYLLASYSNVSIDVAKALFSGTRVEAAIKLIRRISVVNDPGEFHLQELELILFASWKN
jgi:hypothetical protein